MQDKIRLNKYIAGSGVYSRRQADELVLAGKVKINGVVVNTPGVSVGQNDTVEVNGENIKKVIDKKYVIFYKPSGYITTRSDDEGRKTIYDLFPPELQKLKSAGRLDKDSSGLLILTNDGDLIQNLIHPSKKVPKTYTVRAKGKVTQADLIKFKKGIEIEKGKTAYAEGQIIDYSNSVTTLEITLFQGLNRQIRKMFEAVGCSVISLKRTGHACLTLGGLNRGRYRYLAKKEVQDLYNYLKNLK